MTEKPILFSGAMVRAILSGSKTVTRRIIPEKVQEAYANYDDWCSNVSAGVPTSREFGSEQEFYLARTRFEVGDLLWVRESFADLTDFMEAPMFRGRTSPIFYKADGESIGCHPWKPSIHMPRKLSRITLEVTGVKVERLQDISEEEAKAEGIAQCGRFWCVSPDDDWNNAWGTAKAAFHALWESINGEREGASWEANPFVAAISFRRIKP